MYMYVPIKKSNQIKDIMSLIKLRKHLKNLILESEFYYDNCKDHAPSLRWAHRFQRKL